MLNPTPAFLSQHKRQNDLTKKAHEAVRQSRAKARAQKTPPPPRAEERSEPPPLSSPAQTASPHAPAPFVLHDPDGLYAALGLKPRGATKVPSDDAIRNARNEQVLRWHPDRPGGDHERMQRVNGAFSRLESGASVARPALGALPQSSATDAPWPSPSSHPLRGAAHPVPKLAGPARVREAAMGRPRRETAMHGLESWHRHSAQRQSHPTSAHVWPSSPASSASSAFSLENHSRRQGDRCPPCRHLRQ